MKFVLGIDTSCDDTGVGIVADGRIPLSNFVNSQVQIHAKYGGVVPELASRNHIKNILPAIEKALGDANIKLKDIDGIAVTIGPGLIGSLLVGLQTAKALSLSSQIPFCGVNHLEAHINAIFLSHNTPDFPYIGLVVSGGHTSLYRVDGFGQYLCIGETLDDAAGEAFDKVATLLGLPYPGGVEIDKISKTGDPKFHHFPRPMAGEDDNNFSFSGIKTSVKIYLSKIENDFLLRNKHHIGASFQEAVVDTLIVKTLNAAKKEGLKDIVFAGGVASNSRLRKKAGEEFEKNGLRLFLTPLEFCTDNGAMVASIGYHYLFGSLRKKQNRLNYCIDAYPNQPLDIGGRGKI